MSPSADAHSRSLRSEAGVRTGPMVLVVEDEDAVREFASWVLNLVGYSAVPCATGEQALDVLRAVGNSIALVLWDVLLPGVGGAEFQSRARSLVPGIRMVAMSGMDLAELREQGVDVDPASFIGKPFRSEDLTQRIRAIFARAA